MSATQITIPDSFTVAINEVVNEARNGVVQALAAKYGFDPSEAIAFLGQDAPKLVQKTGSGGKKSKKSKKADSKPKTKRPPTGYLVYSAACRDEVKSDLSVELGPDEKLKPQAVVKELAARWAKLDHSERLIWNERAALAVTEEDA